MLVTLHVVFFLFSWDIKFPIHSSSQQLVQENWEKTWPGLIFWQHNPSVGVSHQVATASDHCPIILDTCLEKQHYARPFIFLIAWIWDSSCKEVVKKAWNFSVAGLPSFNLVDNFKWQGKSSAIGTSKVLGYANLKSRNSWIKFKNSTKKKLHIHANGVPNGKFKTFS